MKFTIFCINNIKLCGDSLTAWTMVPVLAVDRVTVSGGLQTVPCSDSVANTVVSTATVAAKLTYSVPMNIKTRVFIFMLCLWQCSMLTDTVSVTVTHCQWGFGDDWSCWSDV